MIRFFTLFWGYFFIVKAFAQPDTTYTALPDSSHLLQQVYQLDWSRQQRTELPAQLFECTNLRVLNLNSNLLTELPSELFQLTQLQALYLDNNRLEGLPKEFKNLKQLKELSLSGALWTNNATAALNMLLKSSQLQRLSLDFNALTSLPNGFKNLKNLRHCRCTTTNSQSYPVALPNYLL